jgi:general secretion pathway protein G
MMFVLTLILIAASISQPIYQNMTLRAREAALRDTLFTMRSMIDRFTLDIKRPPESLNEMVEKGYLGDIPVDPLTHSQQTWQVETEER